MKFLLLLAVLVGASFAASPPKLPTTFTANTTFEIIDSTGPTVIGKGSVAEDNANQKMLTCFTPDGSTETDCLLKVYSEKKVYNYTRDATGKLLNCTVSPLPANDSSYRNEWVWLPESRDQGTTTNSYCQESGVTYELKFEGKIDLKLILNEKGDQPAVTDYTLTSSTGTDELIECIQEFEATINPNDFIPPSPCKPGLIDEKKAKFLFRGIF